MMESNVKQFEAGAQKPKYFSLAEKIRNFSKGNVPEENRAGNFRMMRFRVPHTIYDVLLRMASDRNVTVSRLIIEILRSVVEKELAKHNPE